MIVQSGKREIFLNSDEVALVERIDPEAVTVTYVSGSDQHGYDSGDRNLAQAIVNAFARDPKFIRLKDGKHYLNINKVRRVEFLMGEANVTLPKGNTVQYTAKSDIEAIKNAVS